MEFFVMKSEIVKPEHVKRSETGSEPCDVKNSLIVLMCCRKNFFLRKETGERRNSCNGKARQQETQMSDRHFFSQASHVFHFITVNKMNHRTRAEKKQRLEKCVREKMKHGAIESFAIRAAIT